MAKRSTKKQLAPHAPTPLQPETVVILYHQRTGVISHTHFFSVANGGKLPGREELERVALAHAEKDGCDIKVHKAIHVDPTMLKRGTAYRVAVGKRSAGLVEVKAAAKKSAPSLRGI